MTTDTEDERRSWSVHTAPGGLKFYFDLRTLRSQWAKPEALMTPEERHMLRTDWSICTRADEKQFY